MLLADERGRVVGREAELERIASFLDDATPFALWLEGAAGIGKTTLLRAAVELARGRGYRVLACQPTAAETALSFASLGDLLEPVVDEVLPRLPPPQRQAAEAALGLGSAGARVNERLTALAVLSALRLLAGEQRVLVAIDDLQWLDRPSAAVLRFALRRLAGEPVKAALCVRLDGDMPPPTELETDLAASSMRLSVRALSLGALQRIVSLQLGRAVPRPVMRRVHEACGGNPFYGLAIAQFLAEEAVEP